MRGLNCGLIAFKLCIGRVRSRQVFSLVLVIRAFDLHFADIVGKRGFLGSNPIDAIFQVFTDADCRGLQMGISFSSHCSISF